MTVLVATGIPDVSRGRYLHYQSEKGGSCKSLIFGGPGRDRTDDLFHAIVGGLTVVNNLQGFRELPTIQKHLKTLTSRPILGLDLGLEYAELRRVDLSTSYCSTSLLLLSHSLHRRRSR